jgi:hypothetical protein
MNSVIECEGDGEQGRSQKILWEGAGQQKFSVL